MNIHDFSPVSQAASGATRIRWGYLLFIEFLDVILLSSACEVEKRDTFEQLRETHVF